MPREILKDLVKTALKIILNNTVGQKERKKWWGKHGQLMLKPMKRQVKVLIENQDSLL